jgi:hypothetical protein
MVLEMPQSRQEPNWRRFAPYVWLFGFSLPFVSLLAGVLLERVLGVIIPGPPRGGVFLLLAVAIVVTSTACFMSTLPLPAKIMAILGTILLFPIALMMFGFLVALIFGMQAT